MRLYEVLQTAFLLDLFGYGESNGAGSWRAVFGIFSSCAQASVF